MSSKGARAAVPEPAKDWEDDYRKLQQHHNELKVLCNEQEEHIRKLQAKVRKLETDYTQLLGGGQVKPRDKEQESYIATLQEQNTKLRTSNSNLVEKNKQLVELVEKKKREITTIKREVTRLKSARPPTGTRDSTVIPDVEVRPGPTPHLSGTKRPAFEEPIPPPAPMQQSSADSNLIEVARKYKERLTSAQEQLAQLRDENARLRSSTVTAAPTPAATAKNNSAELETQLRDANWRLQQLQTQYDFLSSKSSSQGSAHKRAEEQLEEYSQKVRELRRALEELRNEKEHTDVKAARVSDLEETMAELRAANRSLEDKISRLCEAPFISDAFGQQESRLRYEEAVSEREELRAKVAHLQEAVRTHYSALTTLKQHAAQLREEKEDAEKKAEEMRMKYQELDANTNLLQDKLRLYSGDDGVDIESLERALTLVKRRGEALENLPFKGDAEGENLVMLPVVKRKLEESQLMNLKLTQEVERLESMLKLQSGINRDLHKELEAQVQKRDKDKRDLIQRAEDFEEMAMKRLEKIHQLEAQVRQHVYGTVKNRSQAGLQNAVGGGLIQDALQAVTGNDGDTLSEGDNPLLAQLIDEHGGDLNPDENLLEVWVKGAAIKEGMLVPGSSTFMVIDFFDYESQATGLISGQKPQWDFAATFKIAVDDFLLRYFAMDVLTLELNMASQGDFTMLARCALPLSGLLKSKPLIRLTNHPMISVRTGEILAQVNLEIRLAIPVSELYRLFLERHPGEKKMIQDIATKRALEASGDVDKAKQIDVARLGATAEDEVRLYNELEIAVLRATGLPNSGDGKPPTAYVHFQVLGHPDKVTNPVAGSCEPTFNERFVFPMVTNEQQLRLLQRSKLELTVIDMKGEETDVRDDDKDGLIGEVSISLAEVAEGSQTMDTFVVKDRDGKKMGELQLAVRWKFPLRTQRDMGPRALSCVEVEHLISAFTSGMGEPVEGLVSYNEFCRFVSPPRDVEHAIEKLSQYATRMAEKEARTARDIFRILTDDMPAISQDFFVQRMLATQVDCLPADFTALFKFVDMDEDGSISLDQLMAILNIDNESGIPTSVQAKLRLRVKDMQSRSISLEKLFKDADQWGTDGFVSRMEFKGVLKKMGFQLVDDVEPVSVTAYPARARGGKGSGSGSGGGSSRDLYALQDDDGDALNDTMGSDDILVPDGHSSNRMDLPGGGNKKCSSKFQVSDLQREIFEKQRKELVERSKRAAALVMEQKGGAGAGVGAGVGAVSFDERSMAAGGGGGGGGGRGSRDNHVVAVGKNILHDDGDDDQRVGYGGNALRAAANLPSDEEDPHDRHGQRHHSYVARSGNAPRDLDVSVQEEMATRIQAVYRSKAVRSRLTPDGNSPRSRARAGIADVSSGKPTKAQRNLNQRFESDVAAAGGGGPVDASAAIAAGNTMDILKAEQSIRDSLRKLEGAHPVPNLLGGFQTVDTKRAGYVNRKQFAHVMKQFPAIELHGAELRASMDYFDRSGEGKNIDYQAFIRLCQYREPDLLPEVNRLQKMVLSPKSVSAMRVYDANGSGYIRRSDMLRALAELGHGQISQSIVIKMLELFETKVEGHVNYANFVEYVRENGICLTVDALSRRLHAMVSGHEKDAAKGPLSYELEIDRSKVVDDQAIRGWFKQIDRNARGMFDFAQLAEFLDQYDITAPRDAILALYSSMTRDGQPVRTSDFAQWLRSLPEAIVANAALYTNLSLSELQRKANIYMLAIAASGANLDSLAASFAVYDWLKPPTGALGKAAFVHATRRVGFTFTNGELRLLAAEFGVNDGSGRVSYRTFLAWATPGSDGAARARTAEIATRHTPSAIVKFLEHALKRGADLLGIFGRYDAAGVGRMTADEFCSALSDLGLSTVTQKLALETADRFRAAAGDFVLYRRVVEELLRMADDTAGASEIDVVDAVKASLQRSRVELRRLRDVFEHYDRKGVGKVREEDLGTIFDEADVKIRRPELDGIADKFNIGGSNWINYINLLTALEGRMTEAPISRKLTTVPEEVAAKTRALIETLIVRGMDYRSELDKKDDAFGGSVLQADFREILQERFRSGFTVRELEALERGYRDVNDPRKVSFVRLIHDMHPRHFGRQAFDTNTDVEQIWQLAEELRQKIRRRCDYLTPGELRAPFRHFARTKSDRYGSSIRSSASHLVAKVSQEDFALAVRDLGMRLASDQEFALFEMINIGGSSGFTYSDFVVFVCDPQQQDVVWKLRRALARAKVPEKEIVAALGYQDSNKSGLVTGKQFSRAMASCNVELSDSDIGRIMLRFDREENQRLDIERFLRFIRGQPVERNDDEENVDPRTRTARFGGGAGDEESDPVGGRMTLEAAESRAYSSIRSRVEEMLDNGYTASEVFALFDPEGKGTVDLQSVFIGAREVGAPLSRPEARGVLRRMSLYAGGAVTKGTFFEALDVDPRPTDESRSAARRGQSRDRDRDRGQSRDRDRGRSRDRDSDREDRDRSEIDDRDKGRDDDRKSFEDIMDDLRRKLERVSDDNMEERPEKILRKHLERNAIEREDSVTQKELAKVFDRLSISIPRSDIVRIFDKLDRRDRGYVDIIAMMESVYAGSGPRRSERGGGGREDRTDSGSTDISAVFRKRPDLQEDVVANLIRLKAENKGTLRDLQAELKYADSERSGMLDKAAFSKCLSTFGFKLRLEKERDLADSLAEASSGRNDRGRKVDYPEFISAVKSLLRAEDQTDDVMDILRRKISKNLKQGANMEKLFSRMDRDGNGEVEIDEFKRALEDLGIPLNREEARRIVARFAPNGRSIKFKDFVRSFSPHTGTSTADKELIDMVIDRMRHLMEDRLGGKTNPAKRLKDAFVRFDRNGDGKVSHAEFKDGLVDLKIDLTRSEIDQVLRRFDADNSGYLDYSEFMDLLQFDTGELLSPKETTSLVEKIRRKLEDDLGSEANSAKRIKDVFTDIDVDGSNSISKNELIEAMQMLKIRLKAHEASSILAKFGDERTGDMKYKDFLDFLGFAAASSPPSDTDHRPRSARSPRGSAAGSSDAINVVAILSKIRRSIEDELGSDAQSARRIKQVFADIDRDGSNTIDRHEFADAMKILRVDVQPREAEAIFDRYGSEKGRDINYKDFLDLLGFTSSSSSGSGKEGVGAVLEKIRRSLEDTLGSQANSARRIKEVFSEIDRDGNGTIDKHEFADAMGILKIDLRKGEMITIFDRYGSDKTGDLNYKDFLDLLGFKAAAAPPPRDDGRERSFRGRVR